MDRSEFETVRSLPLFAELSPAGVEAVVAQASIVPFPAKSIVLYEGPNPDWLYVLLEGLVQLYTRSDKEEATVLLLRPVTCFITAAVLRDEPLLTSARTIQAARILQLPAATTRRLYREEQGFARAIAEDLALNYRNSVRELKNMRARTGFQRLIAWILGMQAEAANPAELELPYDKGLLAARLGIAPETLSRDLARLGELGVVVQGRRLQISPDNRLRQFISADDLHTPSLP